MKTTNQFIIILGPTASGKTRLAANLAAKINGEIISADSRQVYRDMNIGTGKDYEDYIIDGKKIPYHLVDIVEAGSDYHIAQFQNDFQVAFEKITNLGKVSILCGGSGMYLDAVLRNYEFTQTPINQVLRDELQQKTHEELLQIFKESPSEYSHLADVSTKKRLVRAIEISRQLAVGSRQSSTSLRLTNPKSNRNGKLFRNPKVFGINLPTEIRRERITKRLYHRLENGMIQEVEGLLRSGILPEKLIFYGLEYKFITQYLMSQLPYNEMVTKLETAIHQFAKRQMTYFRGMERKGTTIHWLDGLKDIEEQLEEIKKAMKKF
jgi:tRNA dimethylallyltransferase